MQKIPRQEKRTIGDQFLFKCNSSETFKRTKYDSTFNVHFPSDMKIDTIFAFKWQYKH